MTGHNTCGTRRQFAQGWHFLFFFFLDWKVTNRKCVGIVSVCVVGYRRQAMLECVYILWGASKLKNDLHANYCFFMQIDWYNSDWYFLFLKNIAKRFYLWCHSCRFLTQFQHMQSFLNTPNRIWLIKTHWAHCRNFNIRSASSQESMIYRCWA